ncbi:MAG: class I tRNA ligase family protein [Candidatus Kerfeldbacteria bacterium]|nr:class I tRNA ligase family protein [Candidatus Kerfeldbacteria bacterium]
MSGHKTLESRALNPFEKERLYGDLKTGMTIKAIFSETGETAYLRILKRWTFKRLEDFFKRKELIQKMNLRKDYSTVSFEEFRDGYRFTPDYLERIEKHGLVAWEIERVIPGIVPVPEDQLPVELPHVERFQPTDTGESPLASIPDWVNTPCPTCGGPAKRETDTMPNWAGSSWYFLRYTDPKNHKVFADQKKLEYWMPVDIYNGGMEHTVLHLLYSRFWHKFLFDLGLVPGAEPYRHRHSHGLVLGEDGQKMSKSRGNVVNPDDLVREYGADSLRLYEMFMGPFEEPIPWSTRGIVGVHRFLQGVYDLVSGDRTSNDADRIRDEEVVRIQHKTVKQVSEDLEQFKFNTAVSALMEFANTLKKADRSTSAHTEALRTLLLLLAPMAPHLASELWETAFGGDVSKQAWPAYDPARLIESTIPFVVQVNGKVRAQLTVPFDTTRKDAEHLALDNENVQKFVRGTPKKVIFVPNKLINFVV